MKFDGRGARRLESENLLAYRVFDSNQQVVGQGIVRTLDISRTGISFEAFSPLQKETRIELTIGIGPDVVRAMGTIKNCTAITEKTFHVGVEFDFLSEDDLNKIAMVYPDILK